MKMLTSVSGMLKTIMEVKVTTMVMSELNTCAMLVEITCRSESMSLV